MTERRASGRSGPQPEIKSRAYTLPHTRLWPRSPLLPARLAQSVHVAGYVFISPWLAGFLLLTLWPIAQSFYLSFTNYSLLADPVWTGLDNYRTMFTGDATFVKSLRVTFTYVAVSLPLTMVFSLLVALLLNKEVRGMNIYRTAIYFPSLIGGSIAVSVLWRNMFGLNGYINVVLGWFGIEGRGWISHPSTALWTLIILAVWQFGSKMVIFLAGLKQIPHELYEAASVDGAGTIRRFFRITLPMLSPVILFNLVLGVINAFQMFTAAYIVTPRPGGPVQSTYLYAVFLYEKAFKHFQMGYASALAWVLLVIVAVLTALNFALSRYWVFYEAERGGR